MSDDNNSEFFDGGLLAAFNAKIGAYSKVTAQEAEKSQITITGPEAEVVVGYFGKNDIHHGPKSKNEEKATKTFKLFNLDGSYGNASLTVNYPKPPKGELQVYASVREGFRPRAGDIWFVYLDRNTGEIVIGSMTDDQWQEFTNTATRNVIDENGSGLLQEETEDLIFQEIINQPVNPKTAALTKRMQYPRSRATALNALRASKYLCEVDPQHGTFTNRFTENPYIEAHHLIPLSRQDEFKNSLDVPANIVGICPLCHRKIHHGILQDHESILKTLYNLKEKALHEAGIGISIDKIKEYYS